MPGVPSRSHATFTATDRLRRKPTLTSRACCRAASIESNIASAMSKFALPVFASSPRSPNLFHFVGRLRLAVAACAALVIHGGFPIKRTVLSATRLSSFAGSSRKISLTSTVALSLSREATCRVISTYVELTSQASQGILRVFAGPVARNAPVPTVGSTSKSILSIFTTSQILVASAWGVWKSPKGSSSRRECAPIG